METEKKKLVLPKVFSLDHYLATTLAQLKPESSCKQSKRNLAYFRGKCVSRRQKNNRATLRRFGVQIFMRR